MSPYPIAIAIVAAAFMVCLMMNRFADALSNIKAKQTTTYKCRDVSPSDSGRGSM